MIRCTLHVTVKDVGELAAFVEAVKALGHPVECPAFDGRERLKERDELLRRAGSLISAGSTWGKCVELSGEIAKFQGIVWPRWRDLPSPPEGCSKLRRYLFEARRLGELPCSARHVYSILKPDGAGHFSSGHDQLSAETPTARHST